jgi:hypothetical protein
MKVLSRILLAFSAIVFAFGAYIYTSAFGRMSDAVAKSDLPLFLGSGFKALWLQDSALQILFAIIFAAVAIRPCTPNRPIVVILGLLPITTAVLIYHFIGNFVGGHIFLAGGLAAILGGLLLPAKSDQR